MCQCFPEILNKHPYFVVSRGWRTWLTVLDLLPRDGWKRSQDLVLTETNIHKHGLLFVILCMWLQNAGLCLETRPLPPDWKDATSELWFHQEYARMGWVGGRVGWGVGGISITSPYSWQWIALIVFNDVVVAVSQSGINVLSSGRSVGRHVQPLRRNISLLTFNTYWITRAPPPQKKPANTHIEPRLQHFLAGERLYLHMWSG